MAAVNPKAGTATTHNSVLIEIRRREGANWQLAGMRDDAIACILGG
jgi:hypothetical protein